jgi:MinD-like ATPase involved in chromosome partitioning or flagellar assembly
VAAITNDDITNAITKKKAPDKLNELRNKREELVSTRVIREEEARIRNELNKDLGPAEVDPTELLARMDQEAKDRLTRHDFVCPELAPLISLYYHQLLLVGAGSGRGKSTVVAMAAKSLTQDNKRVLIISGEESAPSVMARIACLRLGVSFWEFNSKPPKMSPSNLLAVRKEVQELAKLVTVIDTSYESNPAYVTSRDGVMAVLNANKDSHDAIIIDYYTKVYWDTKRSGLSSIEVQAQFSQDLDFLKGNYNGPIIVMAQLHPTSKDNQEFQTRLQGRRLIYNVCTDAVEIISVNKTFETKVKLHKSRFDAYNCGKNKCFGYDRDLGIWVPNHKNDPDFQARKSKWQMEANMAGLEDDPEEVPASGKSKDDKQFKGADFQAGQKLKGK